MQVPLYQPLAPPPHLQHWLKGVLPGYHFPIVAGMVAAEHGSWTQILIKPKGMGAELVTGMPVVARILMALGFFGGLLPGIVFVIVYYVALGSKIDNMKAQLFAALTGQPIPPGPGLGGIMGAPGSMPMPGMGGAPVAMAPALPRSSIHPLAPIWMIVMMVIFFGASGTAGALAYDEGWDKIDRRIDQIEHIEGNLEVAKAQYAWLEKDKKPPKGCPIEPGSYASRYGLKECHGCESHTIKPTYVEPDHTVHRRKRDKDWLVCPPLRLFKSKVEDEELYLEIAKNGLEEARLFAMAGTAGAGALFVGFLAFLVIWIRKNKVMRKKRAEELAAPVV